LFELFGFFRIGVIRVVRVTRNRVIRVVRVTRNGVIRNRVIRVVCVVWIVRNGALCYDLFYV
jgi:hypothetical protein